MMPRMILAPTDFSRGADVALHYAGILAGALEADVLIVYVKPSSVLPHADEDVADPDEPYVHAQLENSSVGDTGILCMRKLLRGNPPDEILNLSKNDKVELIVMGTHGQTNSPHVSMGAVAQAVVSRAECPVLTVKPAVR